MFLFTSLPRRGCGGTSGARLGRFSEDVDDSRAVKAFIDVHTFGECQALISMVIISLYFM